MINYIYMIVWLALCNDNNRGLNPGPLAWATSAQPRLSLIRWSLSVFGLWGSPIYRTPHSVITLTSHYDQQLYTAIIQYTSQLYWKLVLAQTTAAKMAFLMEDKRQATILCVGCMHLTDDFSVKEDHINSNLLQCRRSVATQIMNMWKSAIRTKMQYLATATLTYRFEWRPSHHSFRSHLWLITNLDFTLVQTHLCSA